MNDLLALNKKTFISSYLWIAGIMTLGFSIYFFFFHENIKTELFIIAAVLSVVFFPLVTIAIWTYDWFRKRRYVQRILDERPFRDLNKIGFVNKAIRPNHNSLLDYVRYARINDCEIIFDVDIKRPSVAEFQIYGRTWGLDNSEFLQKSKELKSCNIDLSPIGFKKYINIKTEQLHSIGEIEKVLMEFSYLAKKLKYESIPVSEWEHK